MGLIDKVKENGKKLALAGVLAFVGCSVAEHHAERMPKYPSPPQKEDPHIIYEPRFGGHLYVVSCNFVKDVNNDKILDYPTEYFCIKESFNKSERISVSLIGSGKKFDEIDYILFDINNNREIQRIKKRNVAGSCSVYNPTESELKKWYPNGKLPEGQISELKPGIYRAVWLSKSETVATWDFEVSEDKLVSNK